MKLCEKYEGRSVYRLPPPAAIQRTCNRVQCTDTEGEHCQCWMSYPTDEPFHSKTTDIIIDERRDTYVSTIYYGLSAMAMGALGIILFIALWLKDAFH
ncbi:MAG: hypothetical protein ACFCVA_15480 [Gammaproteobacteria bacterium]